MKKKFSGKFFGLQLLLTFPVGVDFQFPSDSDLHLLFPSDSERCFPIFKTGGFLRPLRETSEQVEFISARTEYYFFTLIPFIPRQIFSFPNVKKTNKSE